MKKKWALALVLALALMLLASDALAEAETAREALKEAYGFTDNTFAFFMQTSAFGEEEGAEIKQYTFVPMQHLESIGVYTVNLSSSTGEVLDTTWSLENIADAPAPIWTARMAERLLLYALNELDTSRIETEVTDYPQEQVARLNRVTIFGNDFPKMIQTILAEQGFEAYSPVRGVMRDVFDSTDDSRLNKTEALLVLEKDGLHYLVGVEKWGERISALYENYQASIYNMGPQLLLSIGGYSLSHLGDRTGVHPRGFAITFPLPNGGSDTYSLMAGWNAGQWRMESFTRREASEKGICIVAGGGFGSAQGFEVFELAPGETDDPIGYYPYYGSYLINSPDSLLSFPISREEAHAQSRASLEYFGEQSIALNLRVNLREKPTGHSKSLGLLYAGLPLEVLGESPGKQEPWYHVRLGKLEGYVSGMYLQKPPRNRDGSLQIDNVNGLNPVLGLLVYPPAPVAYSIDDIRLREKMREDSDTAFEYPKNTLMHVVNEAADGWVYVIVPREDISWEVDRQGNGGYVRIEEIKEYPTALQAQLDMK